MYKKAAVLYETILHGKYNLKIEDIVTFNKLFSQKWGEDEQGIASLQLHACSKRIRKACSM